MGKFQRGRLTRFGKFATDEEIPIVYDRLLNEDREKQLISYLWVFGKRSLPAVGDKIISCIHSDNETLRYASINALSQIQSAEIRDIALSLHDKATALRFAEALPLFILNYQSGDYKYIDRALIDTEDEGLLHEIGSNLLDIFDEGHHDELKQAMLWAYENTPCSYCRSEVVRKLHEENILPESIKSEGKYDCCEDTRILCE